MTLLRVAVERLLALVFGLAGTVTLFMGLSILLAAVVGYAIPGRTEFAPWLGSAMARIAILGAIFVAGGAVLGVIRSRLDRRRGAAAVAEESGHFGWTLAAIIPTLALPAVALASSGKLFALWNEILVGADRLGVRAALARGADPFAGLVLLPLAAVLFVPALELAAAFFLIAVPPFLLALLATRSSRLGTHCALTLAAQVTFVVAAFGGADLFARLADELIRYLKASGGAEATPWLPTLTAMRETVMGTAWRYAALAGASGVCLVVLAALPGSAGDVVEIPPAPAEPPLEPAMLVPGVAAETPASPADRAPAKGAVPAPERAPRPPLANPAYAGVSELPGESRAALDAALARFRSRRGGGEALHPSLAPTVPSAPPVADTVFEVAPWPAPAKLRAQVVRVGRVLLIAWGGLLLFSGACQLAWPRPHFVGSIPSAGGSVPRPPVAVEVRFDHALDPASTIAVRRAVAPDGSPDGSREAFHRASRLEPEDPAARTLEAELRAGLGAGIYRVDWQVMPARGGGARSGCFYFGIGRAVPADLLATPGRPYRERDAGARGRRATLLSGVVLLVLAAILPRPGRRA